MSKFFENLVIRYRVSGYLTFGTWAWFATMMDPNFMSVFVVLIGLGLLFLLRFVSHIEGRSHR